MNNNQLPNGQDLIDDAATNGAWAAHWFATFDQWRQSAEYEIARQRVEALYGRGKDYDAAARKGWGKTTAARPKSGAPQPNSTPKEISDGHH